MLTTSDVKGLCAREPKFDDMICSLRAISRQPQKMWKETREVVALARKFNDEVVRPYAAELDRKVQEDPDFLPHEFVKEANRRGFYTMWIPRIFGGRGYNLPSFSYFIEEIASVCTAMSNLIGVHYLGVGTLIAAWNTRIIQRIFREVVQGEKHGRPCLISLALTEPGAGTDVQETDLMDRGNVACHARKEAGGYVVNGSKVFISNGHLSTWHMLFSFADLEKPSSSLVMLAVKTGTKGFSFGRKERKMGQKGCPASELLFDDCFIADKDVCLDPAQTAKLSRSRTETTMQFIDYVFAASRAGVGAFGTGVARGAYEAALKFAGETDVSGKLLINHEWAQCLLAQMYRNVLISRYAYVESNYANGMDGMYKTLQLKPIYYLIRYTPAAILGKLVPPFMESRLGTWLMRKIHCDWQTKAEIERTSGLGSLAKITGSDAGVKNGQLALDLMGQAGLRQERMAEKHLRDAKLIQIYEGTNQLNRLNLFKCLAAGHLPQVSVFTD
ncbi:MAG: acyl-CoA dehydrogenase family protein [Deltaproteobacteria bacterium]|nr:acyl-CoA dehydrogenase family protein [Deltaproteobacteria bacterium]